MFSIMRRSLLVLVAMLPMWANAAPAVSAHQVVQ
ncbi:MAG: toluene tolerance protein, partial [Proteobacteria bacterium]